MKPSLISTICLLLTLCLQLGGCSGQNSRLQKLVTSCIDLSGEDYCSACPWPRSDSDCKQADVCTKSTEIWHENKYYIAIRDKKMCGCNSPGFIHGLAIPRALISGVESPNRPAGIWHFAWQAGLAKGIESRKMALVINPANDRSENQLHIHIVRLNENARSLFPTERTMTVDTLDNVWKTAATTGKGLDFYGILVAENPAGGYYVVVSPTSPEDLYTIARCRTELR